MSKTIEENQNVVLSALYNIDEESKEVHEYTSGPALSEITGLNAKRLSDAVDLLFEYGFVERLRALGTAPFSFSHVRITSRGKYEAERRKAIYTAVSELAPPLEFNTMFTVEGAKSLGSLLENLQKVPPTPVGSPYGFTDNDWEIVAKRKADEKALYVVLGLRFESEYYETVRIIENINSHFQIAIDRYNVDSEKKVELHFKQLRAGYGEHLFNQIARDIISSDIAVFDTSDLSPNVFLEIGVALTWGSRVFIIKANGSPDPASDISGQTYAVYGKNAEVFSDPDFSENIFRMIEWAVKKKG